MRITGTDTDRIWAISLPPFGLVKTRTENFWKTKSASLSMSLLTNYMHAGCINLT